jgi:hypothetical protein
LFFIPPSREVKFQQTISSDLFNKPSPPIFEHPAAAYLFIAFTDSKSAGYQGSDECRVGDFLNCDKERKPEHLSLCYYGKLNRKAGFMETRTAHAPGFNASSSRISTGLRR